MRKNPNRIKRIGLLLFLLQIPLFASMLGVSDNRFWPLLIARLGVSLTAILLFVDLFLHRQRPILPWTTIPIALFGLLLLVQGLPLPSSLVEFISPETHQLYQTMLSGFGDISRGIDYSLSLDPVNTLRDAGSWFTLVLVFIIASLWLNDERSLRQMMLTIALTAVALCLIAFIHKFTRTDDILFLFKRPPIGQTAILFSTFINNNTFAGFLSMSAPGVLVFCFSKRYRPYAFLLWLGFFLILIMAILLNSHGGYLGLFTSITLFTILYIRLRLKERKRVWVLFLPFLIMMIASVIGYLSGEEKLKEKAKIRVERIEFAKLPEYEYNVRFKLWKDSLRMAKAHPAFGVGKGAFELSYPVYQSFPSEARYVYPENLVARYLSELGAVGLLWMLGFLLLFGSWVFHTRLKLVEIGAIAAMGGVLVSNLFDFGLTMLAVSVPFTAFAGSLSRQIGARRLVSSAWRIRINTLKPPRIILALAVGIFSLISFITLFYWAANRAEVSREEQHALSRNAKLDIETFETASAALANLHPADYYLRLLTADAYRRDEPSELPMRIIHLSKARRLAPYDSHVNMLYTFAMAEAGQVQQALSGFERIDKHSLSKAVRVLLDIGIAPSHLIASLAGRDIGLLYQLAYELMDNDAEKTIALIERWPGQTKEEKLLALRMLFTNARRLGDTKRLKRIADEMRSLAPQNPHGYWYAAELYRHRGEHQKAIDYYQKSLQKGGRRIAYYFMALSAIEMGHFEQARKYLAEAYLDASHSPERKKRIFFLRGVIALKEKKERMASREFHRVLQVDEDHLDSLLMLGHLEAKRENWSKARSFYHTALLSAQKSGKRKKANAILQRLKTIEKTILGESLTP